MQRYIPGVEFAAHEAATFDWLCDMEPKFLPDDPVYWVVDCLWMYIHGVVEQCQVVDRVNDLAPASMQEFLLQLAAKGKEDIRKDILAVFPAWKDRPIPNGWVKLYHEMDEELFVHLYAAGKRLNDAFFMAADQHVTGSLIYGYTLEDADYGLLRRLHLQAAPGSAARELLLGALVSDSLQMKLENALTDLVIVFKDDDWGSDGDWSMSYVDDMFDLLKWSRPVDLVDYLIQAGHPGSDKVDRGEFAVIIHPITKNGVIIKRTW